MKFNMLRMCYVGQPYLPKDAADVVVVVVFYGAGFKVQDECPAGEGGIPG